MLLDVTSISWVLLGNTTGTDEWTSRGIFVVEDEVQGIPAQIQKSLQTDVYSELAKSPSPQGTTNP